MDESVTPQDDQAEIWRPVVGYESFYDVSDLGRVRSKRAVARAASPGGILKPSTIGRGTQMRLAVVLCSNGVRKCRMVHRLVMEAFVGPCPPGQEVRHGRSGPFDNRLASLCYGTHQENCSVDKIRDGTMCQGEAVAHSVKLTESQVREIRARHAAGSITQKALADEFGVTPSTLCAIVLRQTWKHI